MDKSIKISIIIGITAILISIIIAIVSYNQSNRIANQNSEDVKNLINTELKKLNEEQSNQGKDIENLVFLSEPRPIINCWLSEKDNEKQTYKIIITNNGDRLAQLNDIKLESARIYYNSITPKNFNSEITLCSVNNEWLSPGDIIIQECVSDLKVNHITLNTKEGEIICDLNRKN